jgi:hypothetical protein
VTDDDRPPTFGRFNDEQRWALFDAVRLQYVVDLGAGSLEHAILMSNMSASVTAVDMGDLDTRQLVRAWKSCPITLAPRTTFKDFVPAPHARVCLLSWPYSGVLDGLLPLLNQFDRIVVLSKNTDGTACGWPGLYQYLATRELDVYLPDRRNTMMVYGSCHVVRPPRGEERAGMLQYVSAPLRYEEVEG